MLSTPTVQAQCIPILFIALTRSLVSAALVMPPRFGRAPSGHAMTSSTSSVAALAITQLARPCRMLAAACRGACWLLEAAAAAARHVGVQGQRSQAAIRMYVRLPVLRLCNARLSATNEAQMIICWTARVCSSSNEGWQWQDRLLAYYLSPAQRAATRQSAEWTRQLDRAFCDGDPPPSLQKQFLH